MSFRSPAPIVRFSQQFHQVANLDLSQCNPELSQFNPELNTPVGVELLRLRASAEGEVSPAHGYSKLPRNCHNLTRNCLPRYILGLTFTRNCHNLTRSCLPQVSANSALPHMGMTMQSKTVKQRGNVMKLGDMQLPLTPSNLLRTASRGNLSRGGSPPTLLSSPPGPAVSSVDRSSSRFGKMIEGHLDELAASGADTVIMSRRDALRALQDELLARYVIYI